MRNITDAMQAETDVPYEAAQQALLALTVCGKRELSGADGGTHMPDGKAGAAMLTTLRQHGQAVRQAAPGR